MPIFGARGVFTTGRTIPAILTQKVRQGETVIFDAREGVFVNAPALGFGPNSKGLINVTNLGIGDPLSSVSGNSLKLKSLAAGTNVTLSDDGNTITINSTGGSGPTTGFVSVLYKMLDYTSGVTDLITLPQGAIILCTEVAVMTAFNSAATFTIGTVAVPDLLVENAEVDLTMVMSFKDDVSFVLPGSGSQDIKAFLSPNGSSQGQISVFIEYFIES